MGVEDGAVYCEGKGVFMWRWRHDVDMVRKHL